MTARYSLFILPRAEDDLAEIYAWLCKRTVMGAKRWFLAFELALERVSVSPLEFGATKEAARLQKPIRQVLFKTPKGRTYRAVFLVSEDRIYVLRIRGPGQPPLANDEFEILKDYES